MAALCAFKMLRELLIYHNGGKAIFESLNSGLKTSSCI
jgi:hypothetical protein